jgi:general secretion pathway protein F
MPIYQYKGIRRDGRSASGIIDAESPRSARVKLRKESIYPTDFLEAGPAHGHRAVGRRPHNKAWSFGLSMQDLANLTGQLATLLAAGLPLVEALGLLIDQSETNELRSLLADVREQIREGRSFSAALECHPKTFSPVYIHMVRAGEASGALDHILSQLSEFLEAQAALQQKVTAAALYPALMLLVSLAVLAFLMTFVVPKITAVFADLHQVLPWPTRVLMGMSGFLAAYWWMLVGGVAVAAIGMHRQLNTPAGRARADRFVLTLPVLGLLVRKVAIARFAGTLATMLSSGVQLLHALDVGKRVMNNAVLEEAVESARQNIREGESIAEPLKRSGHIPALVTHMITVGEKSGELEGMLRRVSHIYSRDVERLIAKLTSVLEPAMILLMGVIVFGIVLAILLPIFEMSHMVR